MEAEAEAEAEAVAEMGGIAAGRPRRGDAEVEEGAEGAACSWLRGEAAHRTSLTLHMAGRRKAVAPQPLSRRELAWAGASSRHETLGFITQG